MTELLGFTRQVEISGRDPAWPAATCVRRKSSNARLVPKPQNDGAYVSESPEWQHSCPKPPSQASMVLRYRLRKQASHRMTPCHPPCPQYPQRRNITFTTLNYKHDLNDNTMESPIPCRSDFQKICWPIDCPMASQSVTSDRPLQRFCRDPAIRVTRKQCGLHTL